MFKLVVLSALLAAVVAEPGLLSVPAPLTYSATYVSPASTTISQQASSVIHPSPLFYSSGYPYAHLIKKRSPGLIAAPYYASTVYSPATPLVSTPLAYQTPIVTAPLTSVHYTAPIAHLIKKRSVTYVAPSTYIPTTYTPTTSFLTTAYTAPYYAAAAPYYSPYLIKK